MNHSEKLNIDQIEELLIDQGLQEKEYSELMTWLSTMGEGITAQTLLDWLEGLGATHYRRLIGKGVAVYRQ